MDILPFIIIATIFIIIFALFFTKQKKIVVIPMVLPQEGFSVPVSNAYIGSVFFNLHNGVWPSLKLFEDHCEFVVLWKKSLPYGTIQEVEIRTGFWAGGGTLVIKFNNGSWDYNANLNKQNLKEVLKFLQSKSIKLTEEAKNLINQ
jgi:hypothetical protein